MKRNISTSLSFFLLPALVLAADPAQLQKVSGTVEFKPSKESAWSQAQPGAQIPSGGSVRTGADGRAEIKFKNKSSVWLKPSTNVAVEQKGPKHNQIVLGAGSLKIRVPHLRRKEKFEVKTPVAVASVRGTVFSIDSEKVQTFFGQVNMNFDDGKVVKLPQGMSFDGKDTVLLSQMDEVLGLEDWTPGLSDQERRAGLVEFLENRQEIRDYAEDALARNSELVDSLADKVKESDFAAGRTLTDVHGNLVRVEQRLDRPDNKTVQVTNITLRKSYASGGLRHYSYNGANTARIDALIAKAEFNQALPESLNEFPGFFSANEDSVKVDRASLILANMSDPTEIATIAFLGQRNGGSGTDDIDSDLYVGEINGRGNLFDLSMANATDGSHNLTRFVETSADTINFDADGGELYGRSAKQFSQFGNASNKIWVCTESFVINNGGQVRNVDDFTGGGINVQDLLSNSAGQSVVFVKMNNGSNRPDNTSTGDYFNSNQNIDLVIIPDLFLSVAKSLATSADAFKTTY